MRMLLRRLNATNEKRTRGSANAESVLAAKQRQPNFSDIENTHIASLSIRRPWPETNSSHVRPQAASPLQATGDELIPIQK